MRTNIFSFSFILTVPRVAETNQFSLRHCPLGGEKRSLSKSARFHALYSLSSQISTIQVLVLLPQKNQILFHKIYSPVLYRLW